MTGRIGVMGTPPEHWYYAGRDHVLFAVEPDVHRHALSALALPPQPPGLRQRLTGHQDLELARVELLPEKLVKPTAQRAAESPRDWARQRDF
jgi:hypothetical protein